MRIISVLITALAEEFQCSRREVMFRLLLGKQGRLSHLYAW